MKVTDEQDRLIREWIELGEPRMRTEMRCCDRWGLSLPQAQQLVAYVMRDVAGSLRNIERPEFLAQQMTRLEALAAKAQEDGHLGVALGCYKELHALAKLHAT